MVGGVPSIPASVGNGVTVAYGVGVGGTTVPGVLVRKGGLCGGSGVAVGGRISSLVGARVGPAADGAGGSV